MDQSSKSAAYGPRARWRFYLSYDRVCPDALQQYPTGEFTTSPSIKSVVFHSGVAGTQDNATVFGPAKRN
ncbi:MAG: hypothetical protein IPO07_24745 [Haliscomenobacter sp.]|nr:hypothetical protein [Haliscomenobacter sp.]MBK9491648.1 hypothetical protein [Haliscomenobacter sp.]